MSGAALGTKLKKGTTVIAELTSIGGLELTADTIDVTTLDSADGYRKFIQGLKDGGEVSLSGFLNPADGKGQDELLEAFDSGDEEDYFIEFPEPISFKWSFKGIVTGFNTGAELEDAVSFESTIKVSGKPTLAAVTP